MSDLGRLPKLPSGLEYRLVTEAMEPCENCGGGVRKGGVMIGQSRRRKSDTFKRYFPMESGFCLNCAKKQFGLMVAKYYEEAESKIDALDKLQIQFPGTTAVEQQKELVDAITEFITGLGVVLRDQKQFEVEYVTPPFMDKLEDMRGVKTPESTDGEG